MLDRQVKRMLADPRCHDYLAERLARAMNSLAPAEPFFAWVHYMEAHAPYAPGERIMSSRFQGNKGYLVTFEFIDPLFTLDLSDNTNPRVVGASATDPVTLSRRAGNPSIAFISSSPQRWLAAPMPA